MTCPKHDEPLTLATVKATILLSPHLYLFKISCQAILRACHSPSIKPSSKYLFESLWCKDGIMTLLNSGSFEPGHCERRPKRSDENLEVPILCKSTLMASASLLPRR